MNNFKNLGVSDAVLTMLDEMNFTTPTPIQEQAIPLIMEGRDILGSAQTGTGKTGAFGIPLIEKLLATEKDAAIILTPTRELAAQVLKAIDSFLPSRQFVKSALLIGGEPMGKQLHQLRRNPRLIVGTPGRVNDHLERKTLKLHDTKFLVLDEMDRMLDMGFSVQIDRIVKCMTSDRQTLLFSATIPTSIEKVAAKYQRNPKRISVGSVSKPMEKIKQEMVVVKADAKYNELLVQLTEREGSVIVFVKTKHGADRMAKRLSADDFRADAVHGDLKQSKRDRVLKSFRNKDIRIMVATDVAARGLDVPHIEHVVNYDLPQCPEDYIHRVGRTARGGASGSAINILTSADNGKWNAILRLIDPEAAKSLPRESKSGKSSGRGRAPRRSSGGFGSSRNDNRSSGSRNDRSSRGSRDDYASRGGRNESRDRNEVSGRDFSSDRNEGRSSNERGGRKEGWSKSGYGDRNESRDRNERSDRNFRSDRNEGRSNNERGDRNENRDRNFRSDRNEGRSSNERGDRNESRDRNFKSDRSERGDRNEKRGNGVRSDRSKGNSNRKPPSRDGRGGEKPRSRRTSNGDYAPTSHKARTNNYHVKRRQSSAAA